MKPSAVLTIVIPLGVALYVLVDFAKPPWIPLKVIGLILAVGGIGALTVARYQLGNSFSVRPVARELVTHGIYSKLRNPVYIFSAVGLVGLVLYVNRLEFLWLLAVVVPVQALRAREEGKVLEEKFGDVYRAYKEQAWF